MLWLGGTSTISGHGDALRITSQYPAPSSSAEREQSGATASEPQGMLIRDAAVPFPRLTLCTFTPQQPDIQGSSLPQPFPPVPSLKHHSLPFPMVRFGAEQCPCPRTQVWAGKRREDAKVCISQPRAAPRGCRSPRAPASHCHSLLPLAMNTALISTRHQSNTAPASPSPAATLPLQRCCQQGGKPGQHQLHPRWVRASGWTRAGTRSRAPAWLCTLSLDLLPSTSILHHAVEKQSNK